MALEIITIGGIDILSQAFNAVATITSNTTFFNLMYVAEIIGVLACVIKYIKTRDIKVMGLWLLFFVVVNGLLLTPKQSLVLTDTTQPTKVKKVDNVPLGVALPFYLFSLGGNSLAQMYDKFFSQPNDLQYTKTGLLFGQRLLEDTFYLKSSSEEFNINIDKFIKSCTIPDIQLNHKYTFQQLGSEKNLFNRLFNSSTQSELRTMSYTRGDNSSFISCKEGANLLKNALHNELQNGTNSEFTRLLAKYGIGNNRTQTALNGTVQSVYGYLMKLSQSSVDIYKQNILINVLRREFAAYPASLGAEADMVSVASEQTLNKMRLAHLSSYKVAGKMLPALYTVFSAFMVGIFPIMVLLLFVTEITVSIIKNYAGFLFSLMLYPVLFAIFSSIINVLTYQQLGGEPFTLSNANTLKSNIADVAGIASWLMLSIPFISFGLVKGLGQAISSAGSYLGNALASATSADAAAVSTGNYNWGNMQMENINGFKTNLNQEFRSGMSTIQNSDGSLTSTTSSGKLIFDSQSSNSKLPMKIDWTKTNSTSLTEEMRVTKENSVRANEGYRNSMTAAQSILDSISNRSATATTNGSGWNSANGFSGGTSYNKDKSFGGDTKSDNVTKFDHSSGSNTQGALSADVSTKVSGGFQVFGTGATVEGSIKAGVMGTSSDGTQSSNAQSYSLAKNASDSLKRGDSISNVLNYLETNMHSVTDSNELARLKSATNELRNAQEHYRDFVESEAKVKTMSDIASSSKTSSVVCSRDLSQALTERVFSRYSDEQARDILSGNPNAANEKILEQEIKAVSEKYIADTVANYQQNREMLSGKYDSISIDRKGVIAPSEKLESPDLKNDGVIPNSNQGYRQDSKGNTDKQKLEGIFKQLGNEFKGEEARIKEEQQTAKNNIDKQSDGVGGVAKTLNRKPFAPEKKDSFSDVMERMPKIK